MKTIIITGSPGCETHIDVPDEATIEIRTQEAQPEGPKVRYFIKSKDEILKLDAPCWNYKGQMDHLCGREITAEEYAKIKNNNYAEFEWSKPFWIFPRHIKEVTEPKIYRIMTKEELLANGWKERKSFSGNSLVNPNINLCNILEREQVVLGSVVPKEAYDAAQTQRCVTISSFRMPSNVFTDKPYGKHRPKELDEEHKILTYNFLLHMPWNGVLVDGSLKCAYGRAVFTPGMRCLGDRVLTENEKAKLLRGESTQVFDEKGIDWTVEPWMTTLCPYYEKLRVRDYDKLRDDPNVIVYNRGKDYEYLQHRDRIISVGFHIALKCYSGTVISEEQFRTMLREESCVLEDTAKKCRVVPWKLEVAS